MRSTSAAVRKLLTSGRAAIAIVTWHAAPRPHGEPTAGVSSFPGTFAHPVGTGSFGLTFGKVHDEYTADQLSGQAARSAT